LIAFADADMTSASSAWAEFLLRCADLGQRRHGIERPVLRA
jgi:hypothetical protein